MMCCKPIYVEAAAGVIPCGRCFHCRQQKKAERKGRLLLEDRQAEDGKISFVTLTYDEEHLPRSVMHPKTGEIFQSELGTLDKWELIKFNKRWREAYYRIHKVRPRFAACGEYGDEGRPHYHMIVFGASPKDLGPQDRTDYGVIYDAWVDHKGVLKCSPERLTIEQPRNTGHVSAYISDYLMKGSKSDRQRQAGERYPEFFLSSQGLARSAVAGLASAMRTDSAWQYIWDRGEIPRTFDLDGKTYILDRYMRNKILEYFGPTIQEEIKRLGQERFKDEMQILRRKAGIIKAPSLSLTKEEGQLLSKQFVSEHAQEMILREDRYARFNPTKRGL